MFKPRSNLSKSAKRHRESDSEASGGSGGENDSVPKAVIPPRKRAGIPISADTVEEQSESQLLEPSKSEPQASILTADEAFRMTESFGSADHDLKTGSKGTVFPHVTADETEDGAYRGQNAYRAYVTQDEHRKPIKPKVIGSSASGIRISSRFDYQMDICKDFKETGYCGFGDSCKFLHDRSEFKNSWELEREWQAKQKDLEKTRKEDGSDQAAPIDESTLCGFCKREWKDCETPSCVTTCRHYFCEKCFMAHSAIHCSVCGKLTHGIFNAP